MTSGGVSEKITEHIFTVENYEENDNLINRQCIKNSGLHGSILKRYVEIKKIIGKNCAF